MKLVRFGPIGAEKPGIVDASGQIRDVSAHVSDFGGDSVSLTALDSLRSIDLDACPTVDSATRLGACLGWVPNFHCVGLNYARHAAESGMAAPAEPVLFSKATTSLSGPTDPIVQPRDSEKLDWEVELGVVIGRDVSYVSEADALGCVAGYCVINDVSERKFQLELTGQWVKGKSAPTFGPTGPYLVTADEVPDPQALGLWLEVNGEKAQSSSTSDMIFGVAHIVSYMSRFMALRAGDIIATGTPEGVGMGHKPPRYLKPGDTVRLGIDGLGEQRQDVVAAP
ncbi:MAG: fumarylacetoacetate hydrolase family protein [Rhodobacteraceae bacterium]|nr:fumarylacetoacetate hydrolase family protein [Paracoccaceae bacterium]